MNYNLKLLISGLTFLAAGNLYAQDGNLDNSFASNGIYTLTKNSATLFYCGDVYPDGGLVVGGLTVNSGSKSFVVRLNENGSLRTGFGSNGSVEHNMGPVQRIAISGSKIFVLTSKYLYCLDSGGSLINSVNLPDSVASLSMDHSPGAVYVCGYNNSDKTVLLKYDKASLTLMTSFGNNGVYANNFSSNAGWEQGKDILYRDGVLYGLSIYTKGATRLDDLGYVYKMDTSGQLITSFGNNGSALVADTTNDYQWPGKLAWSKKEKALFLGGSDYLVKVNAATGLIDKSYANNGVFRLSTAGFFAKLTVQSDGKPILFTTTENSPRDFKLVRTTTSGVPDSSFGTSGQVVTSIGAEDFCDYILYDSTNNKIIAIGHGDNASVVGIVVRYNSSKKVGISPVSKATYSILPNPCQDKFTVTGQDFHDVDVVVLYDQLGRIVADGVTQDKTNNTFYLNRSKIPNGIYHVGVQSEEKVWFGRLVVAGR